VKIDRLRYRLLPYIYAVAGAVTHEGGTMLRPLVMDFRADAAARTVADQFMFGPALLVSPVTTHRARSRAVYLPATAGGWYDLWTGAHVAGGGTVEAPAPFDALPVHARAGAIVPVGPELQHTGEKPADPITLHVYAGADGAFSLYEDDGLTYGYERGALSRIPIRWDDARRTLVIGAREGSFPGMLARRTFHVVLVTPERPAAFPGAAAGAGAATTITYDGAAVERRLALPPPASPHR
jgi:alpha-D-xyloside xylohydrolase